MGVWNEWSTWASYHLTATLLHEAPYRHCPQRRHCIEIEVSQAPNEESGNFVLWDRQPASPNKCQRRYNHRNKRWYDAIPSSVQGMAYRVWWNTVDRGTHMWYSISWVCTQGYSNWRFVGVDTQKSRFILGFKKERYSIWSGMPCDFLSQNTTWIS